ncbi:MAG: LTA synthase family protein, partial [Acidobacteriota bacterium]
MALPPLLLRIAQVGPLGFTSGDLRGFASDLVVTLLAATLTLPLARRGRWLAAALAGFFAVLAVGNDEHLRALGAQARPGQAGYLLDATFVAGSVLPLLGSARLWGCLGAAALVLWLAFRGGKRKSPRRPKGRTPATAMALAGGAAAAGVALALWPLDGDSARWRQANVFEGAVRDGLRSGVPPSTPGGAGPAATDSPGDLDGTPLFSLGGAENVLLVILEGVSGGHLASLAEAQGHGDLPDLMPRLDAFARRHLAYSSFVAQQRQTNRGEYALLCGRLPSLAGGSPTMSEAAREARPLPCLPRALKDLGYRTVYLQAAPLAFMLKDQFMPLAGFDEAHGDEWFQNPHLHNQWGVDDRTFFEQSLGMVEQLRRNRADGGAPWFLTLLTVGTHHPFNAPEDFPSQHAPGTFPWAAEYLDHRVADFLDALEQAGVLDDTAVLLTSDESVGLARGQDDLERLMAQAWGFLVIAAPGGPEGQRIQQPFAQSDLPITILDLLGRDDAARAVGGRRARRRYGAARTR